MSLEQMIADLTVAIEANTAALRVALGQVPAPAFPTPAAAVAAPPVVEATIVPAPAPTPVMPAPPAFVAAPAPAAPAPVNAPVTVQAPFSDAASMTKYAVGVYEAIKGNPDKVNGMNEVIKSLGCAALTDVQPHQYGVLYAGLEALK